MNDLIKKSDAIKAFTLNSKGERIPFVDCDNFPVEFPLRYIVDTLAALPPADRPQGEWLLSDLQNQADNDNGNYAYICTNCNHTDIHAKTQEVPFCWWCGAKMKGADEVEWVYNKRERLWYPYLNGELLFKTENSQELPCTNCSYKESRPCCCCMEFIAWKRKLLRMNGKDR